MTSQLDRATLPADTTMMSVVHDALRRDFARLQTVLARPEVPDAQRVAVAEHTAWVMDLLHHHHEGEDAGLWPLVRSRSAAAGDLLDRMEADHAAIVPLMGEVEQAAAAYRSSAAARTRLVSALDDLGVALLPHLRAEEDEAMPLVSASISAADWEAWDQRTNVKGKPFLTLADQGHFLIDGLDPARYDLFVHLLPAVPRFLLLKGFARRYRTACARRWGADVPCGPAL